MSEHKSSAAVADFLAQRGFKVTWPWKDLPTAFRAVAGSGRPRIGMLAEYDALPDCGAKPGLFGHGCGHNLLGAAIAAAAAVAAKVLADRGRKGTIIVFGTPAEESLGGKVFMAEHRAFAGLDAVLAWHPSTVTEANLAGGAAMDSILFRFRGKTAHAAGDPHKGRSALDAAVLMDVAVNYLREHVEDNVRMHCVLPAGGSAPNVVPDRAELWYYLRGKDRKQVDDVRRRVMLCARGAALATETSCRSTVLTCCTERVGNMALAEMFDAILRRGGPPKFTPADGRAAKAVDKRFVYTDKITPILLIPSRASSDEDNVSWFAPLGRLNVACNPKGCVSHHRVTALMASLPAAHRGMVKAAEYLAAGVVELAGNAPLLRRAQQEFRAKMKGRTYRVPVIRASVALSSEYPRRPGA
jgi:aminobenzoyl-glutamate utilization protein B